MYEAKKKDEKNWFNHAFSSTEMIIGNDCVKLFHFDFQFNFSLPLPPLPRAHQLSVESMSFHMCAAALDFSLNSSASNMVVSSVELVYFVGFFFGFSARQFRRRHSLSPTPSWQANERALDVSNVSHPPQIAIQLLFLLVLFLRCRRQFSMGMYSCSE